MSLLLELAINEPQDYKNDLRTNKESFQDILGRIDCNIGSLNRTVWLRELFSAKEQLIATTLQFLASLAKHTSF